MISDASKDMKWLNSGGGDNVSVILDDSIKKEIMDQYSIEEPEGISGAYFLVLGHLNISTNKTIYIKPEKISCLSLKRN